MQDHDTIRILAYGEILWDQLPTGNHIGGAPYNFAYRAHCMGAQVGIASRLGVDDLGRSAFDKIGALGLDRSLVQWDEAHPTGTVGIGFDEQRVAKIDVREQAAFDHIEPAPALLESAASADCICFGTLIQRSPRSRATLYQVLESAPRAVKVLDINLRERCYTPESIAASLGHATVLKLNRQEAAELAALFDLPGAVPEFAAQAARRWSLDTVVVTLEERGAFALSSGGERVYSPGFSVELTDPLGAGDAFTAAFVVSRLRGASLAESCRSGNALGALAASRSGATAAIDGAELDAVLRSAARCADEALLPFGHEEADLLCRS